MPTSLSDPPARINKRSWRRQGVADVDNPPDTASGSYDDADQHPFSVVERPTAAEDPCPHCRKGAARSALASASSDWPPLPATRSDRRTGQHRSRRECAPCRYLDRPSRCGAPRIAVVGEGVVRRHREPCQAPGSPSGRAGARQLDDRDSGRRRRRDHRNWAIGGEQEHCQGAGRGAWTGAGSTPNGRCRVCAAAAHVMRALGPLGCW